VRPVTRDRRKLIGEFAGNIRSTVFNGRPNTELETLVGELGGQIRSLPTDNTMAFERVVKAEDGSFIIYLDDTCPPTRRLFSIAHELGHLFLHMRYGDAQWEAIPVGAGYERAPNVFTPVETDANVFASAFLMPEEDFRAAAEKHFDGTRFYNAVEVAKHFGVSVQAAAIRGKDLGIWR